MRKKFLLIIFISSLIFTCDLLSQDNSGKKENLGPNINSKSAELNPVISVDGKTLFFTRRNHSENMGYGKNDFDDDIWYSTLDNTGNWTVANNIGYPLNNYCFSSVCSVSPDGNRLLIQGLYDKIDCKKNKIELCLFFSDKIKNGWSIPEKLKINDFFNYNVYADFYLSSDGKVLLMAIEYLESYGDLDIYVSFLKPNGEWSIPMDLGNTINTNQKEYSPFIASDGVSLYFSSKGHGGFGDADVFISRRLDDTWANWSVPENLGSTINTSGADAYYVIPASGDYIYFVSTDNSYGAEDIFRASLPGNVQPKPVVLISGKIINPNTKEPVEANISVEILPDGNNIGTYKSNPETGDYKIVLPAGYKYGIKIEAKGYIFSNDIYDARKITGYTESEKITELYPIEEGTTVQLNNIYFELNKAELKTESYPELDKVVNFLNGNPTIKIEISGHTDSTGSDEINNKLSEDRAKTVKNYIISNGIPEDRIESKGYGSKKPVASNATPEGWALNRRVEFTVLDQNYVSKVVKEEIVIKENKNENKEVNNFNRSEEIIGVTYFELNQIILTAKNFLDLDKALAYLKDNPDVQIEIEGHSDATGGSEEANLKVSETRAKAVWEYITSRFVSYANITYNGYGSKKPVTNNDTEQNRNLNRRVEIVVIKK